MSLIFDPPIDPADLAGRRVTIVVLGKGRTAAGLARWLIDRGAKVTLTDRKTADQLAEGLARVGDLPVDLVLGPSSDDAALAEPDLVFVMPGIRPRSATILRAPGSTFSRLSSFSTEPAVPTSTQTTPRWTM